MSSSCHGLTGDCTARSSLEATIAKKHAEEAMRAGLPVVRMSLMEMGMPKEEEKAREAAGPPFISETSSEQELLPRRGRSSSINKNKPRPACSKARGSDSRPGSRSRSGSRTRSGSVASVTSVKSNAATVVEKSRKAQRELELKVRRCMEKAAVARAESCEDMGEFSDVVLVSDDEECHEKRDSDSDTEWVDAQETERSDGKRKRKHQRTRSLPDPKRGRPPTTRKYTGLAETKQALNEQKKEKERLEREKKIRLLSSDELLAHVGVDMDEEIEEARHGPTAVLASRARDGMMEVLRVARVSSNIKGDLRKVPRTAAISATAVVEVLRTCADYPADPDVPRQLREIREELAKTKAEAARASEEAKRLREELAERKTRRRKRVYVRDSPPISPDRGRKEEEAVQTAAMAVAAPSSMEEIAGTPMEMEVEAEEGDRTPKYCDVRRKREILPPRKEWPAAVRPALQGKVKILEDLPLVGHKVKLVDGRKEKEKMKERERKERTLPETKAAEEERGGAQLLMEQLAPPKQMAGGEPYLPGIRGEDWRWEHEHGSGQATSHHRRQEG